MLGIRSFVLPGSVRALVPDIGAARSRLDRAGEAFAAVVLVALLATPALAAPSISGLEVRPTHFSPNGDGVQDSTEVRFTPVSADSEVTLDVAVVRVSDGVTVDVLRAGTPAPAGAEVGVDWSPGPVTDGRYRFDVVVTDGTGSAQESAEVVADSTPPVVSFEPLSKNPFDPQVAPLSFKVDITSDSTTTTVLQVDHLGARVDSLGIATGSGTRSFSWNGNLTGGGAAASGRYELRATSADLAGNTAGVTQTVTLDRDPPKFEPAEGDTVGTTSFPLELTGLAIDEDRVEQVTVSFDSSKTFVPPDFVSAPDSTVQYRVTVTDPAPQPGRRRIVLRAMDGYGHVTDQNIVVAYDTFFPVPTSSRVLDDDGIIADGDSVIVETTWNAPGLMVHADFSDLDTGPETQVTSDEGGGRYLIRHRVSPTNSKAPSTRRIVITATTGFLSGADTVQVVLVDRHGGDLVSLDRNRFDPLAGDKVTIASKVSSRAVHVEIYDLSGHRVRQLDATGFVEWDGRNEDGHEVASGVYLLKVKAGTGEEIRKVAVLRGGGQ